MPLPGTAVVRRLIVAATLLASVALASGTVRGQQQESELERRIKHPNMDLHFEGFEKSFDTKASGSGKQATVHPFGFGGRSPGFKGDGAFHAKSFNDGRGSFATANYTTRSAVSGDRQALTQGDRTYATRSVDVREDRAANKPANTRQFANADKPFLVPGKRQDTIDDLRTQKNLSVEQIREILNKSR